MRTQSPDTSPEAERVQIELLRKASDAQRMSLMTSLSQMALQLSWEGIRDTHPGVDENEVRLIAVALNYGQATADAIRLLVRGRRVVSIPANILDALLPVVEAFQQLGVPYYIGGSVASSRYGFPRSTQDLDLVADLRLEHVQPLVARLQTSYYVSEDALRDAIQHKTSFNVIHLASMLKVDVFVSKSRPYNREVFQRVREMPVAGTLPSHVVAWASPEDTILAKLEWYRLGGEISDRQWNDILGIMKVQGQALDISYLKQWAPSLNVADLLDRALDDAGLSGG